MGRGILKKLNKEEKEFIKNNWGTLPKDVLKNTIGISLKKLYDTARKLGIKIDETKKGRKNNNSEEFWKPYLDELFNNNQPFIIQNKTKDNAKKIWLVNYRRKTQNIIITTIGKKKEQIVFTENTRIQAWELAITSSLIKKKGNYFSRYGPAILGKKTLWKKPDIKIKGRGRRPMLRCECGGQLKTLYAQNPKKQGFKRITKLIFWCWKCEKITKYNKEK